MPNPEVKIERKKVNPFCFFPNAGVKADFGKDRFVYRYGDGTIDENHHYIPKIDKVDVQAEIDACKDLAGFDQMQKLLKCGMAKPEDFYDDGKHGADLSQLPENQHEAAAQASALGSEIAEVAKALGVPEGEVLTGAQFEKYLTEFVAKKFAEQQAAASAKEGE